MNWSGRQVAVVGLGKSGVSAVRLLSGAGARVHVTDSRSAQTLATIRAELNDAVTSWDLGGHDVEKLRQADLIVLSPGVALALEALQPARRAGVPIWSEIELAWQFLSAEKNAPPLAGITGTNGKSTTTALTAHLLQESGQRVFAGGNLGTPLSTLALSGERVDAVVCELSSFQLETCETLAPRAAAVLNITPDHLDRYASIADYIAAKARIFARQTERDAAILNAGDPAVAALAHDRRARVLFFAGQDLRDDAGTLITAAGERFTVSSKALRGAHNRENAMAAILLARELGASPSGLQRGLATYPGLPHRLEQVATIGGIEFINDSKATNIDSVEKSLSAFDRGVHLILGGRGKGSPYEPLRQLLPGRVVAIYVIGEDGPNIARALDGIVPIESCGALSTAVARAHANAKSGDVVLLSPACASYDQFDHFEHRGNVFKTLVRALAAE